MKKLLALLLLSPLVSGEDMILKCEGESYVDPNGLGEFEGESYFKLKDGLVSFVHEGERLNNVVFEGRAEYQWINVPDKGWKMNYLKGIDRGSNPNCILDGNKPF